MPRSPWAGLPTELVLFVIQQTDDQQTLLNWCQATRGNAILHKDALLCAWRDSYICAKDLLLAPDEIKNEEWALRPEDGVRKMEHDPDDIQTYPYNYLHRLHQTIPSIQTIPGTGIALRNTARLLLENRQNPKRKINRAITSFGNRVPAHNIRCLKLDLSIETLLSRRYPRLQPSIQSLVYSLGLLFPHLTNLETLIFDGPISNEVIDNLASHLDPSKLKSLTVRASHTDYKYLRNNSEPAAGCESLDFARLAKFKVLETLVINDLATGEHESIGEVVPRLTSLKRLDLLVRPSSDEAGLFRVFARPESPLQLLLGFRHGSHGGCWLFRLPPNLKSLRLVDNYYLGPDRVEYPPAPPGYESSSSPALEELITELDDLCLTANILSWFPRSRLRRLSISLVCREYGGQASVDAPTHVNSLIKLHLDSLQEIIFSNAWKLGPYFHRSFDREWGSNFSITDLVLGTDRGPTVVHHDPLLTICDYLAALSVDAHFGSYLLRIRIENNDAANADDSDDARLEPLLSTQDVFKHIRILIVSPKRINQKSSKGVDIGAHEQETLAWKISRYGPPSLRYISIGQYAFWVDRSEGSTDFTLVPWSHATGSDHRLKWEVHEWATEEDLAFIDPLSRLNRERHGVEVQSAPGYMHLPRWNFFVARRIDGVTWTEPELEPEPEI